MATVTVSASTTLALLTYAADDDIVGTGAATLTCDSNPNALPKPRSISSASNRFKFKVRNSATAFSAGNLWKLQFNQTGAAIGANASLSFTNLAELDIEGEMLECYTATGTASETVLNASNVLGVDIDWPHAIEAETSPGSGVYERVPVFVVGGPGNGFLVTVTKTNFGAGAGPGRVLFYDHTTRLLQTGDGTNGIIFAAGTKFRIPNILVWIDPFTITAAAGWTTGTGSQPVVSSTNFPTVASAGVNVTAGGEVFNISALPSGTAVTVNGRGSEGTTATAHAAGTVLYAIPRSNNTTNYCGRLATQSNGSVRLKNCFFGRFWAIRPRSGSVWYCERAWIVAPTEEGLGVTDNTGGVTFTNSCVYTSPSKPVQTGLSISTNPGPLVLNNILGVVQAAAAYAQSYNTSNPAINVIQQFNISTIQFIRAWKGGIPAGVNHNNAVLFSISLSIVRSAQWNGLELVGGVATLSGLSGVGISNLRYSTTNGSANTTISETAFALSQCSNNIVRDYDVMTGGQAPYRAWFSTDISCSGNIIHNQISGTPRTIDCGSRTVELFSAFQGSSNTHAASYFTNIRATSARAYSNNAGTNNTIRNVRWSELAGATFDTFTMEAQAPFVLDFPPVPISDAQTRAFVDGNTFYAAPNTFPSFLGGIYFGPTPAESALDCYDLSGTAYTDRLGQFYYETTGDIIVFKSTQPIRGVGSIPGTAPQYSGASPSTGATWEFRLCKWGDDITAVSWAAFTGGNVQTAFNALSGYSAAAGLNMQLRVTATTTSAGRYVRQLFVPAQMDTSYVPAVGLVGIDVVGAAPTALAALYNGGGFLIDTATTDGSGAATLDGPYDFDDVPVSGTLKIRALQFESVDTPITWTGAATVPATMPALSGYTSGADTGVTFNKGTKTVTVTSNMTTQDLWSRWRRFIVQLANFDAADSWSYPALDLGDWNIIASGADLTGNLTTTGTATQASGGRFIGVVQASNGSSGVLTVTGLTASQVYVEDDAGVEQDYSASVTGIYTFPTPFGSSGTWRLVVNKPGFYPQAFGFDPQISNTYSITLLEILNPDGTPLYSGGTWPITVTFSTPANCVASFGTEVSVQALFDALQDAYSTDSGMAWLANDNAEATAAIQATGHVLNLPLRTRLSGSAGPAAVAGYVTSQDGTVLDPSSTFPIRYAQSPNAAPTTAQIVTALQAVELPVDVRAVNGLTVDGSGTEADPWGPV